MRSRRLHSPGPDDDPIWVRLYIQQIRDRWAAMLVGDGVLPPEPGALRGMACCGATGGEDEWQVSEITATKSPCWRRRHGDR